MNISSKSYRSLNDKVKKKLFKTPITPGTLFKAKVDLSFAPKIIPAKEIFMYIETKEVKLHFEPYVWQAYFFLNKDGDKVCFECFEITIERFYEKNKRSFERIEL